MELDPIRASIQANLIWIRLAVFALFCATMFGTGWWVNGLRWEAKENKQNKELVDQLAKEQAKYIEQKAFWDAKSQADSVRIESLDQQKDTLLATLSGLKMTRTIKVEPNVQGECESAVLDDSFRLRWNGVVDETSASATADRRHKLPRN